MKHRARLFSIIVVVITAVPLGFAGSQEFKPSKQIEAVVHTGPGGGSDLLARAIAELLQKEKLITQRMQVVNKPGGGPAVAMSYLAEKKGETHTIGFFTGVWVTNPLTTAEATVTVKDLTPIVRLVLEPAVIAVKADSPYKNMKDFIDAAKKNPKQLAQSGRANSIGRPRSGGGFPGPQTYPQPRTQKRSDVRRVLKRWSRSR